jgi:hypothetical protein
VIALSEGRERVIKEKRRHKRNQIAVPVICAYHGEHKIVINHGTSFDLSDSGMCFFTDMPLHEGLKIQVHSSHVWDYPRSSTVKWCSMKNPNLYKVGVMFQ